MKTNNIHSIIIAILISFSIIFVGYLHALNKRYTEMSNGLIFDNWKGYILPLEAHSPIKEK